METLQTLEEVQNYIGMFDTPWIWGGDFNRPPETLMDQGLHIQAQAHTPIGEWTTCSVGGMIDYFPTPIGEQCPVEQCVKIKQSTIRPHDPIQIRVNRRPHLTEVLRPVAAKKWPEAEAVFPKPTWEEATNKLTEMGWKVPKFSTINPMQDLYLSNLGIREESIDLGDMYCQWSATLTVQEISQPFDNQKEIKKYLGHGEPTAFKYQEKASWFSHGSLQATHEA